MVKPRVRTRSSVGSDKIIQHPDHRLPLQSRPASSLTGSRIRTGRRKQLRHQGTRDPRLHRRGPVGPVRAALLGRGRPGGIGARRPTRDRGGDPRAGARPVSAHLFERRRFSRARAGGTDRSQKRKMVPRILISHLYIPSRSSSGGRHTPRRKPQSCRRRCRLRRLNHHRQGAVADW